MAEFNVTDITKSDWVGLRLLSLLLSTDVSNANIKDVTRSMNFYTDKYSHAVVQQAFCMLARDRFVLDEWDCPDSTTVRRMTATVRWK